MGLVVLMTGAVATAVGAGVFCCPANAVGIGLPMGCTDADLGADVVGMMIEHPPTKISIAVAIAPPDNLIMRFRFICCP